MKRIIIFEGADQSGKTTIAKALAEKLNYSYFKNPSQKKQFKIRSNRVVWIAEAAYLIALLEQTDLDKIVLDRWVGSEFAYSFAFNRSTRYDLVFEFDDKMADLGAMMIYCVKDNYENYEDDLISEEDREKIREGFRRYLHKTEIPTFYLNTTDEDLKKQLTLIENFIKENGK